MRFPENLKVMFTLSRVIHLGSVDTDVIRNTFNMDLNRSKNHLRKVSESFKWLELSADKRSVSVDLRYIELRDDYLLKKSLSWFMASEIVFSSVASHHNVAQRLTEIMHRYVLACHKAGVVASPLELSKVFRTSPMILTDK